MISLNIDFESRSTIDLRKTGVYPYAQHPSTDLWCMAYAFGCEEVQIWLPGMPIPAQIVKHVTEGGALRAWNAEFERVMWKYILTPIYGAPLPALEQWYCTAAEAAAMALPRSLDHCAEVLNVEHQKDRQGHALMLRMSKPRSKKGGKIVWWTDEARRARLYEYCRQDVRTERAVGKRVRRLSPIERHYYLHDQAINDRGVQLDVPLIRASQKIVKRGIDHANALIEKLTEGGVDSVTKVADLTRWLQAKGLDLDNVRKSTVRDLLEGEEVQGRERQVLEIRAEAARTSVKKLDSMLQARCSDDRARGLLLYHGASTGRWTGKLIQPQNFPRGEVDDVERFIPAILENDYDAIVSEEVPLTVISSLLRGMIRASQGHRLMVADFSQIEARVLAWIAEQEDLIQRFASGGKVYEAMAARIYSKPVDEIEKDSRERQIGKNTVLGAGYGMGAPKFQRTVWEQTGIKLPDDESAWAIEAYRSMNDSIVRFWKTIERAALRAVKKPGKVVYAGRDGVIQYVMRGKFLWCVLPSKRPLAYALPRVVDRETPWGDIRPAVQFWGVNSITRKWEPRLGYGGLWTENVVQAMSRDLLASAMSRIERAGYPVVLTVHDEIVADVRNDHGDLQQFLELMKKTPRWAEGCPIEVEGYEAERYRK